MMTRREMIVRTGQAAFLGAAAYCTPLIAAAAERRYRIGACDWSLGKTSDPEAFEVGKQIGLDGVQVSLGTVANNMRLCTPEAQRKIKDAAVSTGVQIASLAIGELNNVPYKSEARAEEWVASSVEVCQALNVNVVLLAFFSKGDLRDDSRGTEEVVRRLKKVAPKAEKARVFLGIESWLNAEQHLQIIDAVGSSAVRVYYDVCNSTDRGYDIYSEIRKLGNRICEVHAKENGAFLGQGKVDFKKVREALDDIHYRGWVQIEGAVPPGKTMLESYRQNCKFLRQIFDA